MKKALFLMILTARVIADLPSYDHCTFTECKVRETKVSVPHIPIKESTSGNWSGYAAAFNLVKPLTGSVANVQGTWIVPTLASSTGNTYSSVWVGIDGYANGTVEQIGTEQDWTTSGQQNYAWFEMYPNGAYEIVGFPVHPGDQIGAEVLYKGNGQFQLTIVNYTEHVHTVVPSRYTKSTNAKRSSAEWIVEAPSSSKGVLPLADFQTVTFSNCTATISNSTGPINSRAWIDDPLTMATAQGATKAYPSALTEGGESFTVTWEHP